ncbi:MAG: lysozyme inhibitor LprI family protein [Gallionella sp.]|nr:lysozyme inhibitor LprI family protein [Gallionella sp.]
MNKMIWITLSYLILLPSSQAASFDCAKAQTNVEKLICADAGLSKLDEELNTAYKTFLNISGEHQDVIKNAQRFWLKIRDACSDAECLRQSYEKRLSMFKSDISAKAEIKSDSEICEEVEAGRNGGANLEGFCANRKLKQLNEQLDLIYLNSLDGLPSQQEAEGGQGQKSDLVESQKAWLAFRKSECSLQAELTGAVRMWKSTHFVNCEVIMTQERIKQLSELFP